MLVLSKPMTIGFGAPSNPRTTTLNANYARAIKPTHQREMRVMIGTEGSICISRMEVQTLHGDKMHVKLLLAMVDSGYL